tara:strand:- start:693 stop:932 length:240 start_codon:yes stop_codon:yes gene_type:complete
MENNMNEVQHTNLSKQAIGALMMALQKSLMEQSDIVPVLENFKIATSPEGLVVLNPPLVKFNNESGDNSDFVGDQPEEV